MKYHFSNRKIKIETHNKRNHLPRFLGVVVFILLVAQVIVSNGLANTGVKISKIEEDINKISQENELLGEKIASSSSLMTLSEKAKQFGFVKNVTPLYLSQDLPVALDLR